MDCLTILKAQMLIIIIHVSSLYILASGKRNCFESLGTVRIVTRCPTNQNEWLKREKMYNCSSHKQNCTDPESFVYHCIPNAWQNGFLEVCAIRTSIIGWKCAQFNIGGRMVQEHNKGMCRSCPFKYNSTETYKYKECFDFAKNNSSQIKNTKDNARKTNITALQSSTDCSGFGCRDLIIVLTVGLTFVVLIAAISLHIFMKRHRVKEYCINQERIVHKEADEEIYKEADSQSYKFCDSEEEVIPLEIRKTFQSFIPKEITSHDPLYSGFFSKTGQKYTPSIPSNHDKILSYQEDEPVYKDYTSNAMRLCSFSGFSPEEIVENLANAGFFFEGYDSSTTCFQCGYKKDDWGLEDDAILEHIRLNGTCPFARYIQKARKDANLNEET